MTIGVKCGQCGKQFIADERMAGRRARCKSCGNILQIPKPVEAGQEFDLLEYLKREGGMPPANAGQPSAWKEVGTLEALDEFDQPAGAEDVGIPTRRKNVPFRFPLSYELDQWLPYVLVVGCLIWITRETFAAETLGIRWLPYAKAAGYIALYSLVIFPIAMIGVRKAGARENFDLPPQANWRMFSVFLLAFALAFAMWQIIGSGFGLIAGCIGGVVCAAGPLWLQMRVKEREIPTALAYASAGFLGGMAAAAIIVVLFNIILNGVVQATHNTALAASPVGPGLGWTPATPEHAPPDKRSPAAKRKTGPAEATTGAAPPDATALASGNTPPTTNRSAMAGETPIDVESPPDRSKHNIFTDPPTTRQSDPRIAIAVKRPDDTPDSIGPLVSPTEPEKAPTTSGARVTQPDIASSPFIADIKMAPALGAVEAIFPTVESEWMAAIARNRGDKGQQDAVLLCNADTGRKSAAALFGKEEKVPPGYILAPRGDLLLRIASFPMLPCVQVWSFENDKVARVIELQKDAAIPELMGFRSADEFLIHWPHGVELFSARSGVSRKRFVTADFDNSRRSFEISGDGELLALLTRSRGARGVIEAYIEIYSLTTSVRGKRIQVTDVDWSGSPRPCGLAFSPDQKKLAILLEQGNQALLKVWSVSDGKLLASNLYPAGLGAPRRGEGESRAFDFLADGQHALAFGSALVELDSGKVIGELGFTGVRHQRIVSADKVEIFYTNEKGELQGANVRLNIERLKGKEAKGAAFPAYGR